jgi:hypothetical protein
MANPGMTPSAPAIIPVLCFQVTPAGAVFVVRPVMIITAVPIVDSDLDAAPGSLGPAIIAVGAAMVAAKNSELM